MRDWLKAIRIEKGLSQACVANASNITVQHYSYIESGERRPSPEVARRIADVLGFSNEWYKLLETDRASVR